jgi:hypothetical protein
VTPPTRRRRWSARIWRRPPSWTRLRPGRPPSWRSPPRPNFENLLPVRQNVSSLMRLRQVSEPVADVSGVGLSVAFASGTLASDANASDLGILPNAPPAAAPKRRPCCATGGLRWAASICRLRRRRRRRPQRGPGGAYRQWSVAQTKDIVAGQPLGDSSFDEPNAKGHLLPSHSIPLSELPAGQQAGFGSHRSRSRLRRPVECPSPEIKSRANLRRRPSDGRPPQPAPSG